jgi:hypothetical protein
MVMRTQYHNPSRATWNQNAKRLRTTFEKWGVGFEDWTIESDVEPRQRNSYNPGATGAVTVRYRLPGRQSIVTMTLDSQGTPAKNLGSIAITIDAIRMQERRGLGSIAAAHYLALAAPLSARDPFEVLGLRPDAPQTLIEAAYKTLAKERHPDVGGSHEAMEELNEAKEQALAQVTR